MYTLSGVSALADDAFRVTGLLTINGQSHPVEVVATASAPSAERVVLTAEAEIDRRDWGMSWAKAGASVRNRVVVIAHFNRS